MAIRVLLIDSAAGVRQMMRNALRLRSGFEVVGEAADGGEAVALAASLQPDVVVLDLGLRDLAGRDVVSRIREQSPSSKVVVFSGAESSDRAWIADRVDGYVHESDDPSYLVDMLEALGSRPDWQAILPLMREPENVGRAREFVRGALIGWGLTHLLDDALVVASELVTNAITHTATSCELRVWANPASVRIEVVDCGGGTPDPQQPGTNDEHGRGLNLVAALTAVWGVQLDENGAKIVWAELRHGGVRSATHSPAPRSL